MQIRKYLAPILLTLVLLMNMGLSVLVVQNQVELIENQEATNSYISALNEYLFAVTQEVLTEEGQSGRFNVEIHFKWVHKDPNGVVLATGDHAGVLTTIGLNWIEDQLGDSPSTTPAISISLSNDGGSPALGWTQLPSEIASNGLTRADGTYASTGDGVWTVDKTFTFTGTQSAQLVGLHWVATPSSDNNLLCADQMLAVSGGNGDTLDATWTITIT